MQWRTCRPRRWAFACGQKGWRLQTTLRTSCPGWGTPARWYRRTYGVAAGASCTSSLAPCGVEPQASRGGASFCVARILVRNGGVACSPTRRTARWRNVCFSLMWCHREASPTRLREPLDFASRLDLVELQKELAPNDSSNSFLYGTSRSHSSASGGRMSSPAKAAFLAREHILLCSMLGSSLCGGRRVRMRFAR